VLQSSGSSTPIGLPMTAISSRVSSVGLQPSSAGIYDWFVSSMYLLEFDDLRFCVRPNFCILRVHNIVILALLRNYGRYAELVGRITNFQCNTLTSSHKSCPMSLHWWNNLTHQNLYILSSSKFDHFLNEKSMLVIVSFLDLMLGLTHFRGQSKIANIHL